jgi:hypothetical protein
VGGVASQRERQRETAGHRQRERSLGDRPFLGKHKLPEQGRCCAHRKEQQGRCCAHRRDSRDAPRARTGNAHSARRKRPLWTAGKGPFGPQGKAAAGVQRARADQRGRPCVSCPCGMRGRASPARPSRATFPRVSSPARLRAKSLPRGSSSRKSKRHMGVSCPSY